MNNVDPSTLRRKLVVNSDDTGTLYRENKINTGDPTI